MRDRPNLPDFWREAPLHWLLLIGMWIFLGCAVESDPDDPESKPYIFNEDFVINCQLNGLDCFNLSSAWSEFVAAEKVCDAKSVAISVGEVAHCAALLAAGTGTAGTYCWSDTTGDLLYSAEHDYGDCENFRVAGAVDVFNSGKMAICTAVGGNLECGENTTVDGAISFAPPCTVGSFSGIAIDADACYDGTICQNLQVTTLDRLFSWFFNDPDYTCGDGEFATIRETPAIESTSFINADTGNLLNNGRWGSVTMFSDDTTGSCSGAISLDDGTGDPVPECGFTVTQMDRCNQVMIGENRDGDTVDLTITGMNDGSDRAVILSGRGELNNPESACPGGLTYSDDEFATPIVDGPPSAIDLCLRADCNEAGECFPDPAGAPGYCATFDEAGAFEYFRNQGEASTDASGLDSTTATSPVFVRDPNGPYLLGGEPKHLIVGRDVNLDGVQEVLTVNENPGGYSLVFSSAGSSEPNKIRLDGRVTADEPWLNNEEAMPVGLISDLMVVGIPKDAEGDGGNTGAVWSFKRRGGRWIQQQKIVPENPQGGMRFGYSLSVEEQIDTGEAWLVIGSRTWNTFEGRVDLYKRSGDDWVYHQTLENGENDFFGWDVDINVDIPAGQVDPEWTVAIGAPSYRFDGRGFNTGAVFVSFMGSGASFFSGPAIPVNSESVTANNPGVGRSVAIDGDVIIAGAPGLRVDNNNGAGGVFIYRRGDFSPWALSAEILNPNPVTGEINGANFGFSVDLVKQVVYPRAPTGNYYYLIGAPGNTSEVQGGEAYMFGGGNAGYQRFRRPGGGDPNDKFGHSVAFRDDLIHGNHLFLVSTSFLKTGGAYLYDQPDFPDPWGPINTIDIPNRDEAPANTAIIGEAVAAWDDWVAVSTSNLSVGNDAVYTDLVPIMLSGFESGDVDKDIE